METQKKVMCIEDKDTFGELTINKIYDVLRECDKYYYIVGDDNHPFSYSKKRFKVVQEEIGNLPTPYIPAYINPEHYNHPISPLEYITKNNLSFIEGNIIKYITRYKQKNGKEDLLKAKEYLEHLINNYEN